MSILAESKTNSSSNSTTDCRIHHPKSLLMPEGSPHYAKVICSNCNRFIKWEPKPQTLEKQQQREQLISSLLQSPSLSQWQKSFLTGLKSKKVSPKQQTLLNQIEAKVRGIN